MTAPKLHAPLCNPQGKMTQEREEGVSVPTLDGFGEAGRKAVTKPSVFPRRAQLPAHHSPATECPPPRQDGVQFVFYFITLTFEKVARIAQSFCENNIDSSIVSLPRLPKCYHFAICVLDVCSRQVSRQKLAQTVIKYCAVGGLYCRHFLEFQRQEVRWAQWNTPVTSIWEAETDHKSAWATQSPAQKKKKKRKGSRSSDHAASMVSFW